LFVLSDTLVLSSATPSSNEAKLAFVLRAFDQSGNKLWEQSLGQGASGGSYAAVQAANGHVYVSLYNGPEKNATQDNSQRSIIALDAGDGHQLWKVKEKEAMSTSFTTAPMQLCGDMLYLWSRNSIEARASENGQVVWHHTITELHLHSIQEVRATSKAVIVDGIGGPDQTQRCLDNNWCYLWYGDIVSALNSSNGEQLWQHPFIPDTHLEPGKPITYAQEGIAGIAVSEQAANGR
jgi:outer membrane protein assembly factor BamB